MQSLAFYSKFVKRPDLCKLSWTKISEKPVLIRLYSSWCYYTSFIDAPHNSRFFHIEIPSVYDPSSFGSSICKRGNFMRVFSALEFALANRRFIFFAECVLKSSAAQPMLLLLHKMVQIGVPAV